MVRWNESACDHLWNFFRGPIMMVLRSGQHIEECSLCGATRIVCTGRRDK